jgi:heat shock protein HslJ
MSRSVPESRRLCVACLGTLAALLAGVLTAPAAETGFPFDRELMLDVRPMKGAKRVPMLTIGPSGEAAIDLWCGSIKAQIAIAADTITIATGDRTSQQCTPERMRGDEDLLAALVAVTNWHRVDDVLTLRGPKTLRFRASTH